MRSKSVTNYWQRSNTDVFWGEIAPCDHVVQIYENDSIFLDSLSLYVSGGIKAGDCVIVIATEEHLKNLDLKLNNLGLHIPTLKAIDQYIALNAEETLSKFMVDGWPDETLFMKTVSELIRKARYNNYKIRAFGEMVALLWAQGNTAATIQLEQLWNKFCSTEALCLFCAYPQSGFTEDPKASMLKICETHSKIITVPERSWDELFYKGVVPANLSARV